MSFSFLFLYVLVHLIVLLIHISLFDKKGSFFGQCTIHSAFILVCSVCYLFFRTKGHVDGLTLFLFILNV